MGKSFWFREWASGKRARLALAQHFAGNMNDPHWGEGLGEVNLIRSPC